MVLFSFPLCIVDCVIFCENSTNWSFFWPLFFFFCCYLPLIDMNKQLQDIFISVSPSFFLCTCFLQIDEKSTHCKTNNETWYTFQKKDESWVVEKKWLIAIKNFDNFLFTIILLSFFCNFVRPIFSKFFMVSWTFCHWKCSIMQFYCSIINLY